MKMRATAVALLVAVLAGSALFAAPASGSFIPTIQRTSGGLDQMGTLLMASEGNTAPGLAVAARVHLANAQRFVARELAAAETASATDEELAAYAVALTDLLASIQTLGRLGAELGYTDLSAQAASAQGALVAAVQGQIDLDGRLYDAVMYAPTAGVVWGTVSLRPKLP